MIRRLCRTCERILEAAFWRGYFVLNYFLDHRCARKVSSVIEGYKIRVEFRETCALCCVGHELCSLDWSHDALCRGGRRQRRERIPGDVCVWKMVYKRLRKKTLISCVSEVLCLSPSSSLVSGCCFYSSNVCNINQLGCLPTLSSRIECSQNIKCGRLRLYRVNQS